MYVLVSVLHVSGRTRTFSFGISHLAPLWGEFHARYPDVELSIDLSDRLVDIVEEGFDLAIRIATLQSSTLVSRRITSTRLMACASESWPSFSG